ncbi:3'-5' exonuclease [Desulfospira joergensenii]|uniref:3'-5' exonuclease n=1 Tax=Desulfospira joergensenii TaxID=53329 RepID=UPI000A00F4E2|nr:exonuclease domain-containing protein [Desulfospira joergensenii]
MIQTNRFWKFSFLSAGIVLMLSACILGYIWSGLTLDQTRVLTEILQSNIYALLGLFFILSSAFWVISDIVYTLYIKPIKKISAEAQVIYASNPSHRLTVKGNKDIATLACVINDFADMFENLNKNITRQILSARKETEKERNLLAAIMSEIPHGVIICNKSGRIILFNSLAKKMFTHKIYPGKTERFIGLGRSIFHLIDKSLIAHAMEEIGNQLSTRKESSGSYFITPIYTHRLISVEAIPVLDKDRGMTGFILAFQEISQDIQKYETIENQLFSFRQSLENHIRETSGLMEKMFIPGQVLENHPELDREFNERCRTLEREFLRTSGMIQDISLSKLPLTSLDLNQFLVMVQKKAGVNHNIRINLFNPLKDKQIRADTYSLTSAIVFLMVSISDMVTLHEFDLHVSAEGQTLCFEIGWTGSPLAVEKIEKIKKKRINALPHFDYVLKLNNSHLQVVGEAKTDKIRISTRISDEVTGSAEHRSPVLAGSRPEFYNFNLFKTEDQARPLLDTQLRSLTFTVFDTETTGLNPEAGDEIVSIGAVRIVKNRIVYQDFFEELIDPQREIPIESYRIHGINYEMVRGKDTIDKVLARFKGFASDTVFLGHNIAFDLKMLKVKEKTTGIKFSNPSLDTLLLSAVLHPIHEQHDMENIARRLGVNIIGRHTALGDALTTAEIFLKLIPILNANGILTLKDALKASKKTYYARLKY